MGTQHFYSELPRYPMVPGQLFARPDEFTAVPDDWYVLATDVESSTAFFDKGEWSTVTKLAAGGIDMMVRASVRSGIEIPYVYAGDGIVACFPPELLREVSYESIKLYHYGHSVCGASLRIGIIPVSDVRAAGHNLRVKRVGGDGIIAHSLFDDSAFRWIDQSIKNDTEYRIESLISDIDVATLTYDDFILPVWQKITPTSGDEQFLCMIVVPKQDDRLAVYDRVVSKIGELAPQFFTQHPLVVMEHERIFSVDFIKTSGVLNMIVAGTREQLDQVVAFLDQLEEEGVITHGYTISGNSIVTYLVRESEIYSAGLLDIDEGGYVAATKQFKEKLANV